MGKPLAAAFPKLLPIVQDLDASQRRVDLDRLKVLLGDLDVCRDELGPACMFGANAYKRNTVKETPWYELVVLCWRSGQRTPIHDHQGSSCAFKVIEGIASETRFARTDSGLICPVSTQRLEPGYVCAAWDADIHQVANLELAGKDLVTLHIYSPPFRYYNKYSLDSPQVQRADRTEELYDSGAGV